MRIVRRSRADLDLSKIDWSGVDAATDADKAAITVAQLVSNSSGLPGLLDNPTYAPYLCQYLPNGTLTAIWAASAPAPASANVTAPTVTMSFAHSGAFAAPFAVRLLTFHSRVVRLPHR
jgi:CubicO group peptidase (beta-lactamase class C family)